MRHFTEPILMPWGVRAITPRRITLLWIAVEMKQRGFDGSQNAKKEKNGNTMLKKTLHKTENGRRDVRNGLYIG